MKSHGPVIAKIVIIIERQICTFFIIHIASSSEAMYVIAHADTRNTRVDIYVVKIDTICIIHVGNVTNF